MSVVTPDDSPSELEARLAAEKIIRKFYGLAVIATPSTHALPGH